MPSLGISIFQLHREASPAQRGCQAQPAPGLAVGGRPSLVNRLPPMATELAAWRPAPWALGRLSLRLNRNANRAAISFSIVCSTGNKDRIVRACGKGQQFVGHKEFIFSFPDLSPITRPMAA